MWIFAITFIPIADSPIDVVGVCKIVSIGSNFDRIVPFSTRAIDCWEEPLQILVLFS